MVSVQPQIAESSLAGPESRPYVICNSLAAQSLTCLLYLPTLACRQGLQQLCHHTAGTDTWRLLPGTMFCKLQHLPGAASESTDSIAAPEASYGSSAGPAAASGAGCLVATGVAADSSATEASGTSWEGIPAAASTAAGGPAFWDSNFLALVALLLGLWLGRMRSFSIV